MVQIDEYPRGSIRRMKLTDFMSFVGTVIVEAGSRVNVVEGPNGSGKSSLVTALCMGLAGPIKALGRQSKPEELIRYGCAAFEIEITLSGGAGHPDIVVCRRTEAGGGAAGAGGRRAAKRRRTGGGRAAAGGGEDDEEEDSDDDGEEEEGGGGGAGRERPAGRGSVHTEWRIDRRVVKEAEVKALTRELGINFENLCQFLPQERVSAFSDLSSTGLLTSTEESIGNGELLRQHKELIQLSAALKTKREEVQRMRERLTRLEAEQAAAKPEYDRLQRRNALKEQVKKIHKKRLWVERERCAQQLQAAQARETAEKGKVQEANQRLARAEAPLNARQHAIQAAEAAVASRSQAARCKDGEVRTLLGEIRALEQRCKAAEDDFELLKSRAKEWEDGVARLQHELQAVRQERQGLPTALSPDQAARLAQIGPEMLQAASEAGAVDADLRLRQDQMVQVDSEIRQLEEAERRRSDRQEQRLRKLDSKYPGSRALYEWLGRARAEGRFRRRVLGPVLMELSPVADPVWAGHVEQLAGKNLAAVVVEDIEDNNLVDEWLAQQSGRSRRPLLNKVLFVRSHEPVDYPDGHPSLYARYGVTHTVDQLFEAHELVKRALVDAAGINTAYVAGRQTEGALMDQLLGSTPVRRLLTPSTFTVKVTSQYDPSYRSFRVDDAQQPKLLADNEVVGDAQADQRRMAELRASRTQMEAAVLQLGARRQAAVATEQALREEHRRIVEARKRIETRLNDSARREADLARRLQQRLQQDNPLAGAEGLRQALSRDAQAMLHKAAAAVTLFSDQHRLHTQLAAVALRAAEAQATLQPLKQAVAAARTGVVAAQTAAQAAHTTVVAAQERVREAEARVREEVGPRGPDARLRAAWAEWPDDPAELEQLEAAKQAEIEQAQAALRGDEQAVLESWARREAEMADLRSKSAAGGSETDAAAATLEAKKNEWLPPLRRHMASINQAVLRHFAAIGCAGEVVLREEGEEFEQYAAEIRVKYRPTEPLRPLSRTHHSGGERSVATMMYLMALQGVTKTPFRVVDEINQGMDSRNERKVFNLLVDCSSGDDARTQCILLTPKLISNLHHNEHVRVQCLRYGSAGMFRTGAGQLARMHAAGAAQAEAAEVEDAEDGSAAGRAGRGAGRRGHHHQQQHGLQGRGGAGAGVALGTLPWASEELKAMVFFGKKIAAQLRE